MIALAGALSLSSTAFAAGSSAGEAPSAGPVAGQAYGVPTAGGPPPAAESGHEGLPFSAIDVVLVVGGALVLLVGVAMSFVLATRLAASPASSRRRLLRRLPGRVASGTVRR